MFDCRQKPLCHTNATCTADHINRNRYTCVCNNGFQGNGSVCKGMRVFLNARWRITTYTVNVWIEAGLEIVH